MGKIVLLAAAAIVLSSVSQASTCHSLDGKLAVSIIYGHGYAWVTINGKDAFENRMDSLGVNPTLLVFTVESRDKKSRLSLLTAGEFPDVSHRGTKLMRSAILHTEEKDELLVCKGP